MRFLCPNCGHNFKVSRMRLIFSRRFRGYGTPHPNIPFPWPDPAIVAEVAYYVRCPECGKKSWLTPE